MLILERKLCSLLLIIACFVIVSNGREISKSSKKTRSATKPGHPPPQVLDTETFKKQLKGLLERIDNYESESARLTKQNSHEAQLLPSKGSASTNSLTTGEGPHNIETDAHHCVLHGLWLSAVAGAAIELIPDQLDRYTEIHTKIFDLPDNPYPPLITSQWTGKGIISQESPTTLTVVFQEHIEGAHENHANEKGDGEEVNIQLPRTAVFVGQCLVCQGGPTLQGAWVVFPASQTCTSGAGFMGKNPGATSVQQTGFDSQGGISDQMLLLERY